MKEEHILQFTLYLVHFTLVLKTFSDVLSVTKKDKNVFFHLGNSVSLLNSNQR